MSASFSGSNRLAASVFSRMWSVLRIVVQTALNRHIWSDPERSAQVLARLPAGRWGEPSDIAGACVFLSSPASDYLHGIVLPVDGGWLAR